MSLFSIRRKHHIVQNFLFFCLPIPLGQTHTEGLVCFWRARNPITFETTSVAPNDSPAGCLIALTTGTDTEAASQSTVCAVETFPLGLENVFLHYLMQLLSCIYGFFQSTKCCAQSKKRGKYPAFENYRQSKPGVIFIEFMNTCYSVTLWDKKLLTV